MNESDGWVPHVPGACPVPADTLVEVMLFDEVSRGTAFSAPEPAGVWSWDQRGDGQITAYRVVRS